MTILEPNREKSRWRGFVLLLVATVAVGAVANIWLYAATVDIRHKLAQVEQEQQELTVATAQAKDKLYRLLDAESLQRTAAELGLVLETKPRYLRIETGNEPLATSH